MEKATIGRSLLAALMVGCAASAQSENIGGGHPGVAGVPYLTVDSTFADGDDLVFRIVDGYPGAPGVFVMGLSVVYTPLFGGVLIPNPDANPNITFDSTGVAYFTVPTDPSWIGIETFSQVLCLDPMAVGGWSFSNCAKAVVQDSAIPQVRLSTDGGATWAPPSSAGSITGAAQQVSEIDGDEYHEVITSSGAIYRIRSSNLSLAEQAIWTNVFDGTATSVTISWDVAGAILGVS